MGKIVSIRLSEELYETLSELSDKECRPLALQIRKVLRDYIAQNGSSSVNKSAKERG
jgi:predicted DNA-binding protein